MKPKQSPPNNLASLMSKIVEVMGYLPSVSMTKAYMKFYPNIENVVAVRVNFFKQTSSLYIHEQHL